ncbi:MAG: methylenetetrahydrofolate reductase [Planctomycetes bacterium]|nr:methylenetetrahydrofolate reductase [Planctomycetota bacterium]
MDVASIVTMRLDALVAAKSRTLSFEFFPPKSDRGWHTLEDTIDQLVPLGPDFVSVTYGAGGGTRAKTREIVEHIQAKTGISAMAHLTCVNATKAELRALLDEYAGAGITNLLALRGDPPKGETRFTPTDGGCAHASDLIDLIRADGRFAIACAAFPEKHPDAPDRLSDWGHLVEKFSKGASAAITQCFFEATPYRELVTWLEGRLGRRPRVIPGILPITNWKSLTRFAAICQATIPDGLRSAIEPLGDDAVAVRKAGLRWTIALCRQLLADGAPGLHIYCLNHSTAAAEVVTALRTLGELD